MFIRLAVLIVLLIGLGMAQNWEVVSEEKITDSNDGLFFYPKFSPDGTKIYYTTSKYKGLNSYDLITEEQQVLTETNGAGYLPVFSEDGKTIYYKEISYINRKRQSTLIELDIDRGSEYRIDTGPNQLINPTLINNKTLVFQTHPQFQIVDLNTYKLHKSVSIETALVFTDDLNLYIHQNKSTKRLQPLGEGHYIWASLSPDKKNILFTLAGRGTFICDLDGEIQYELGYAHAPQWSPDGQWILYMDDRDDGHNYTSSELFVASLDGAHRFQLTEKNLIALYPRWAPDGNRLTFHSAEGEIYLLELSYKRSAE